MPTPTTLHPAALATAAMTRVNVAGFEAPCAPTLARAATAPANPPTAAPTLSPWLDQVVREGMGLGSDPLDTEGSE